MLVIMRRGVYPGSFNPLHVAHLAIAEAAVRAAELDRIDFVISTVALAKEDVDRPLVEHRLAVLEDAAASRPWMGAVLTTRQLLADIAAGYDVVVLGADKWSQVQDPAFYGDSIAARDAAVDRLPRLAIVPRDGCDIPLPDGAFVIALPSELAPVSSTAVRHGQRNWLAPEAAAFDRRTGAWSDPHRYERWLSENR